MKTWLGCTALVVLVVACTTKAPRESLETPRPASIDGLAAAIAADAARSDRESVSEVRGELAADATRDADACLAQDPRAAACLYGRAVALGLEARAHPTRARELLNTMLESLASAEAADPSYDDAGPARVRALVLTRAPGWPLGPGDPQAAVDAARRAATLKPGYPPNLLALAEALAKAGDPGGAHRNYERARDAAQSLPASADRDLWLRDADEGLRHQ